MGIAPSESSVLHASFFPFEDSRYKVEDLERLRDLGLQCPQIIMPFQVVMSPKNQRYLIAEDLQSVQKMFKERYKEFLKHDKVEEKLYRKMEDKEKGDAIKRWWATIKRDFLTIFRDVVKGLVFQNKKQNHGCGNLGKNIFVRRKKHGNEYEAKILPLMDAGVDPFDDIVELVNTMQTIIFPSSWEFDFETDQSCPCLPLRKYITFLIGFA
ncbi:hypothetical protein P8452_16526 [Trifolium repens]|nr:hypothetical protein P8452_16526 [Trifolium repens]